MDNLIANAAEILILLFLIITFLQSGIDKVFDWSGNLSWLQGHFADTPLQNLVPVMLGILMLVEVTAGLLLSLIHI